ncbi:YolD-like protein [Peribacillus simplex]|uniref:YolD-like protein n=1 Tax=Peribacillus simplex TaxID=1478 RepID=A0A9X8WMV0_9BACI|nr:YolD-like family protein [Peribacillus simplex]SIS01632.1 YolD-like protein [Peribacillus simplex]
MSTIRDRGLVKWQAALIMPEHKALNNKIGEVDYFLNKKPILDEYQVEEIENNIHYAMEYHLPIRFSLLNEGNPQELHGYVCTFILSRKIYEFRRMIVPLSIFSLMRLLM